MPFIISNQNPELALLQIHRQLLWSVVSYLLGSCSDVALLRPLVSENVLELAVGKRPTNEL
jgi:hypothetical protein